MAINSAHLANIIVGCARDNSRLRFAQLLHACHKGFLDSDLPAACAEADVIILCTPVSQIISDLPNVLRWAKPNAVITDVGSVKSAIVDAADGDPRFVGGHPMAGSELSGVESARPDLFHEATWALTPTISTNPEALATVRKLAQDLGGVVRILSPTVHDEAVAVTSHLPHVLASALMALADVRAKDNADIPFMSAGSFADGTRVAASLPSLWRDICANNRPALSSALSEYRQTLEQFQAAVDSGAANEIEHHFFRGAMAKQNWPRQ